MALPGLGDDIPDVEEQDEITRELRPSTEWRLEVSWTETVEIKLVHGTAEIFGTELAPQQTYQFRGVKFAIWTSYGCRLVTKGLLQSDYIAEETPMVQYLNLHFILHSHRISPTPGPRILIMGPSNSGKTSLAKLLTAYHLRSSDHGVMAVNLDPANGMLAPPGTISAAVMESIVDPETASGWGSAPTNGPMPIPVKLPLVHYYGFKEPETDVPGYRGLVSKLALGVTGRQNREAKIRQSGLIIDAPSSLGTGKAAGLIEHVVAEFAVNIIVVLGSERLCGDMTRKFPDLKVAKADRSGGTVEKDADYNQRMGQEEVHEYFYGDRRVSLHPHSSAIEWSEMAIYKIVDPMATEVDTSFLPGGGADMAGGDSHKQVLEPVSEPTPELQGALLAVVNADISASPRDIRSSPVIGFVHVIEVDTKRRRLKILAPMSGRLPKKTLLWGAFPEPMEMDSTRAR